MCGKEFRICWCTTAGQIAFRLTLLDEAIQKLSDRWGASSHIDLYVEDEVHMVIYVICPYCPESLLAHVLRIAVEVRQRLSPGFCWLLCCRFDLLLDLSGTSFEVILQTVAVKYPQERIGKNLLDIRLDRGLKWAVNVRSVIREAWWSKDSDLVQYPELGCSPMVGLVEL